MLLASSDLHETIRQAVAGNRLIGIVMIFIGLGICNSAVVHRSSPRLESEILAVSASLCMLGPGILYQVAARAMKHHEARGARISMAVALGMLLPAIVALVVVMFFGAEGLSTDISLAGDPGNSRHIGIEDAILMPPLATLFFLPSLLAHAWKISRAISAIRLLPPTGHAFEAIAVGPVGMLPIAPSILPNGGDTDGQSAFVDHPR